ncbi:hypothetical protein OG896_20345 [Streptomyces sp. NBC_00669]|uniref:hypothetical protein n=1 Tax=unclassified Streptomyces TaxID=2593676 RepID=UPI002E1D918D|nr:MULTISPECIES: hypothetical protein [unclassified Streptomyces]
MSGGAEKFEGVEVICGVYDKDAAPALLGNDVEGHSAEQLPSDGVICGVYDKENA